MELLAGFMAGTLMALIFVGHMAIVVVYHPPSFLSRWAEREPSRGFVPIAVTMVTGAMLFWPAVGVGAALLFSRAQERFPTDVPAVPSAVYLAIIVGFALVSAPLPSVLLWRLRRHLLLEYAVFLSIFGLMVPWIAGAE